LRITVDCQGLQTHGSSHRGIGNYCYDFLNTLLAFKDQIQITLLVNGNLPTARIQELIENLSDSENLTINKWYPLNHSSWASGNLKRRELSESLYEAVVRSTRPDKYFLLSPFEGLADDSCWKLPNDVCGTAIYFDAIPRIFPGRYLTSTNTAEFYASVEERLQKFHKIYAISDSSANDASRLLDIEKEKIQTIFFGVTDNEARESISSHSTDSKMILAVLGEDERKNKLGLLKAWEILQNKNLDLKLKIVYEQSEPEALRNKRFLEDSKLNNFVEFLGYVSEDELTRLYNSCVCTIFPSFYEGLGLPVLESFKASKPCLIANTSSLPELVTSVELHFDPNSPEDLVKTLLNLLSDEELQNRAVAEGKLILQKFSDENKLNQMREILNTPCLNHNESIFNKEDQKIDGIYFHTILKPLQSGIANFADNLLHPFHMKTNLQIISDFESQTHYKCPDCEILIEVLTPEIYRKKRVAKYVDIHNLGNSAYHVWQFDLVGQFPGLVLMHDGYLSGLMSVKIQGPSEFLRYVIQDSCALNFLDASMVLEPHLIIQSEKLNSYFFESATSVIVHNSAAAKQIQNEFLIEDSFSLGVIPLPSKVTNFGHQESARSNVIGIFGIIAETKMYKEIIQAWIASKTGKNSNYVLRFIGEDLSSGFQQLMSKYSQKFRIESTGFVNEEEYRKQIGEVRFAIQLRREYRGETSGAIVDLLSAGVPIIANRVPSLNEYPEKSINFIPSSFSSTELSLSIDQVLNDIDTAIENASLARMFLMKNSDPNLCADQIIEKAIHSKSKSEYFPISQLKSLLDEKQVYEGDDSLLKDMAEICLESFMVNFRKKRILVVVNDHALQNLTEFKFALGKLKKEISGLDHPPIFFCVRTTANGIFRTINSLLFDKTVIDMAGEVELKIRARSSDFVVQERPSNSSQEIQKVIETIMLELTGFLETE
jgi:glycosyltransferase involved in cell wall biosynthesis